MAALTVEQALQVAIANHKSGQLAGARAIYLKILSAQPNHAEALHGLGAISIASGRCEEGAELISKAIVHRPDDANYHHNLGEAYRLLKRFDEAVACYRKALSLQPDWAGIHHNLGVALTAMGHFEEAIVSLHRTVSLRPDFPQAHNDLGVALLKSGQITQSLTSYQRAVSLNPHYAEAQWNLFLPLFLLGKYEEAWKANEYRWQCASMAHVARPRSIPTWKGEPVPGRTILVYAEQGFGDTIQFFRYLPFLRDASSASRIILACQPELLGLLRETTTNEPGLEIVASDQTGESNFHTADFSIPLLSLPLALRKWEPLWPGVPYLQADERLRNDLKNLLPADLGFRVGLVWTGSKVHDDDRRRSIPPDALLPILRVSGMVVYNLQLGVKDNDLQCLREAGLRNPPIPIGDFTDTAALMAELDLIITVDTAAAHLAGALGRPVWTLLPFTPDWRWGLDSPQTPWYPTMRLFRQPSAGDWNSVIRQATEELFSFLP